LGTRYSVSIGLTGFLDLMTGVVIDGIEGVADFGVWIWALVGGFLVKRILLRYVTKEGSLVRCESAAATTVDGPFHFILYSFKAS
jgi:hypothetical protein